MNKPQTNTKHVTPLGGRNDTFCIFFSKRDKVGYDIKGKRKRGKKEGSRIGEKKLDLAC